MESEFGIATARNPMLASGTLAKDAKAIADLAATEQADKIVLGIPKVADGEAPVAKIIRRLGSLIEAHGLTVDYVDESLTSHESEQSMTEAGLKASERRKAVDGESACRILERYGSRNG